MSEASSNTAVPNGSGVDVVQLESSDATTARESAGAVAAALMNLGELRAEYAKQEMLCLRQLEQARSEYETIMRSLTRKYVRSGHYNFNAELGAFVRAPEGK